jgi:transcriptional regulator with XRE-family HTH domain
MSAFSDTLVRLRKQDGLTQEEAAKRMGITRSALSMYETAKREPDFETLELIADFYNVNMDSLIRRETKESQSEDLVNGDPELTEILTRARDDPHIRMLFSVTKDAKPEDIEMAIQIIQRFKGE